jgi:hypothetical protein
MRFIVLIIRRTRNSGKLGKTGSTQPKPSMMQRKSSDNARRPDSQRQTATDKTSMELAEWRKTGAEAGKEQEFEKFVAAYEKFDDAFADALLSSL